jgi:hypothetical protein
MFGALGRWPILSRVLGQGISISATQFLSFVWKQTDELLSQATRSPFMLGKYLMISGWASKIAAEELGIDATNYVGLGYLPQKIEDVASPGVDFLSALVDVAAAHGTNSPEKISKAHQRLFDSVTNVVPMKIMGTSLLKLANRISEKELTSSSGDKLRDLDFADQSGLEMLRPETETVPGLGGELLPTLLMQRPIKEELFRRGQAAMYQDDERYHFNLRRAIDNYIIAAESGDAEAEQILLEELQNTYKIVFTGGSALERAVQARSISSILMFIHPQFGGDKALLQRHVETLRRYGIQPTGDM